ncbi:hypothetical protein [Sphingobium yanoikuyae]|uniref:hypothetical protein n=1 Tax=Sphingobium yanoikuyae TaxID=13690 RepID=UPI0026EA2CC1|nr:hypothetical protein [Sphingobium yanoikuyae]
MSAGIGVIAGFLCWSSAHASDWPWIDSLAIARIREMPMPLIYHAGLFAAPLIACLGSAPASAKGEALQGTQVPALPSGTKAPPGTGGIMAPPGDAEEAIRSEFRTMEKRGTRDAYLLFVQRHPKHPLAKEARKRAAALAGTTSD